MEFTFRQPTLTARQPQRIECGTVTVESSETADEQATQDTQPTGTEVETAGGDLGAVLPIVILGIGAYYVLGV